MMGVLATYSNNLWDSSYETSVVVSSLNLAVLGLGGVGHEASSNKLLFLLLLESSSLDCTKVLPEVEPCCCWFPSTYTCGITGFNFGVVLRKIRENIVKCIYFVYFSFVASGLRLLLEKNKPQTFYTVLTTNVMYQSVVCLRIKLIVPNIWLINLTTYLSAILEWEENAKRKFCRDHDCFVEKRHSPLLNLRQRFAK